MVMDYGLLMVMFVNGETNHYIISYRSKPNFQTFDMGDGFLFALPHKINIYQPSTGTKQPFHDGSEARHRLAPPPAASFSRIPRIPAPATCDSKQNDAKCGCTWLYHGLPWYTRWLNRFFWIGLWVKIHVPRVSKSVADQNWLRLENIKLPLFQSIWLNSSEGRSSFWGTFPYEPSPVVTLASEVVTVHPERTPQSHRAQQKLTSKTFSMIPSRGFAPPSYFICLAIGSAPSNSKRPDIDPDIEENTRNNTFLGSSCRIKHENIFEATRHQQRACRNWITFIIRHGSNLWLESHQFHNPKVQTTSIINPWFEIVTSPWFPLNKNS